MPKPNKSIFRQPGARHFQLVHRSQRDPLIHDPEATRHVLKPFERDNVKKGKTRTELEDILGVSDLEHDRTTKVGEAALYGVYYDDTEYDYMQHLRPVGVQEDGVESTLIEAPSTSKQKGKGMSLKDIIPADVLPSKTELPRTYESQQAIPESIAGFQPEMDQHLRQVLEALEDNAFVEDGLEDDFFGELVADGERDSDEEVEFEFAEEGIPDGVVEGDQKEDEAEQGWEARFAQFKKEHEARLATSDDDDYGSEGADTIGRLPEMSVIGGKKRRRKGTSDASGYSMSSSSMYRNTALQTLDEQFDQMMLKEYNEDEEGDEADDDASALSTDDSDEAPELITSRADFESMMDDFLDNYEVLGRKVKPKLEGETGLEKLATFRRAIGQDEHVRVSEAVREGSETEDILMPLDIDDKKDRWDCETILTTYTNLENHPRLIRARDTTKVPKIKLDPRTGLPSVSDDLHANTLSRRAASESDDTDDDDDDESRLRRVTVTRPRNEDKEDKKARKQAVKAERQTRRADKKALKEEFGAERKAQLKALPNKEKAKLKKL